MKALIGFGKMKDDDGDYILLKSAKAYKRLPEVSSNQFVMDIDLVLSVRDK